MANDDGYFMIEKTDPEAADKVKMMRKAGYKVEEFDEHYRVGPVNIEQTGTKTSPVARSSLPPPGGSGLLRRIG